MAWQGLNRRQFPRAQFPCLVKILPQEKGEEAVLAHTENVASGGMCVILKKGLELFTPLTVELDLLDGQEHLSCKARIVWAIRRKATEEQKPSFYDTGIEFVDMHETDRLRLEQMVARLVKGQYRAKL